MTTAESSKEGRVDKYAEIKSWFSGIEPVSLNCVYVEVRELLKDYEDLQKENAELKSKLECHKSGYDGIDCRNKDIKQLEKYIVDLKIKADRYDEVIRVFESAGDL